MNGFVDDCDPCLLDLQTDLSATSDSQSAQFANQHNA